MSNDIIQQLKDLIADNNYVGFYVAKPALSEIDSLRQQLKTTRKALVEAMGWNWLDCENDIPEEVIDQCYSAAKDNEK